MLKQIRIWRPETGVFLGVWLTLVILGQSRLFSDPGSLWHIVVGERILSSGEFIHTDPFSFTAGGKPWIAQWWFGECVLALIHRIDGLNSILLATVTMLAALYTWVAHRLIRAGIHPLVAVLIMGLAIMASSYHFHPRPHIVTIVLIGWSFSRLCDFEAGRISLWQLFWLVPLFVVWTNVHGGMVGGVAMLGLASAAWCLFKLLGQDSPIAGFRQFFVLVLLTLSCGLASLINPYGLDLPRTWFMLMGSRALPRLVVEHASLQIFDPAGCFVLSFGLLYVIALAGILPKRPRVTWLIPLVWLFLAWTRIRHGPLFAITATIALGEFFPHVRWITWLTEHGSELLRVRPIGPAERSWGNMLGPAILPVVILVAACVFQMAGLAVPVLGHGWVRLDPSYWPVDLLPKLRECERENSDGSPIFNDMLFGGFLIYYTPGFRVFIDDRCELYGDEQLEKYVHAMGQDPAQIERWAKQYSIELALVRTDSEFDRFLRSAHNWVVVQETQAATLFRRNVGFDKPSIKPALSVEQE